jgi:hypothetical protein
MKTVCATHGEAHEVADGCKWCDEQAFVDVTKAALSGTLMSERERGYFCQSSDGKHGWFMGHWYRSAHDLLKEIYSDRCDDLILPIEKEVTDD